MESSERLQRCREIFEGLITKSDETDIDTILDRCLEEGLWTEQELDVAARRGLKNDLRQMLRGPFLLGNGTTSYPVNVTHRTEDSSWHVYKRLLDCTAADQAELLSLHIRRQRQAKAHADIVLDEIQRQRGSEVANETLKLATDHAEAAAARWLTRIRPLRPRRRRKPG